MNKGLILAGILAACATGARAAEAEGPRDANRLDVRCVLAMSAMMKNDAYRQWGQFGLFYYTGRLNGRNPDGFNLGEALKREFRVMPAAQYNDEVKRCSDALGEHSRALEDLKPAIARGTGR
jgi:hypothetical protein